MSSHGELADGIDPVVRNAGSWCYIQWSTHNHDNAGHKTSLGRILYSVYVVLGVCCTWCERMIMGWRYRERWLIILFCDDGRVVDEKGRDGKWRWEQCGGYEWICEFRGATWLIGLQRPRIGLISCQIGTGTFHIGDDKLTRTCNSLKFHIIMMIGPISSDLSLSCRQFYHHLRTRSEVIPCNLSMPWSRVNSEYSIYLVQHTPTTAYTEYSIHRVLHTPHTASSQHWLYPAPSQSLISRQTMLYSIHWIPTTTT